MGPAKIKNKLKIGFDRLKSFKTNEEFFTSMKSGNGKKSR